MELISPEASLYSDRSQSRWGQLCRKATANPLRTLSIPLLFLLWEVGAHVVSLVYPESTAMVIMPSLEYIVRTEYPRIANFYGVGFTSQVGHEDSYLIATVVLLQNSFFTLMRLLVGSAIGVSLGVAVGLGMGFDRRFRDIVGPPINLIRSIPALAWTPLFWLWFGGRLTGQLSFIWLTMFLILVISTINAVDNLSPVCVRFAATLGASRWQVYKTVVLPGIVPELSGVMRVVIAAAWAVTLAGEFLGAENGLGYLLVRSVQFLSTGKMLIIVALFMLYSNILNRLFLRLHRHLTRWLP